MKKHEIQVGGHYTARVSGNFVTVRVEAIRSDSVVAGLSWAKDAKQHTYYDVTNLDTGRKLTFRSAAKFRRDLTKQRSKCECPTCVHLGQETI